MASHGLFDNSISLIGQNKVCLNQAKASSISLVRCTRRKNSLVRMDQSQFIAGEYVNLGQDGPITVHFEYVNLNGKL